MIPAAFDYVAPETLEEALELLARHGDEAKLLTGGHSLIPLMKLRLARPGVVIDLRRVSGLHGVEREGDALVLGACLTHQEIADSEIVNAACPLLAVTATEIGDLQVRNVGTIGGSVVHADPASDWPAALLAADAEMVLRGPDGERTVPAGSFFVSMLESAARPDEILTAVRVPVPPAGHREAYLKVPQSASGFALAGVAVQLVIRGGRIESAAVGVTGVAETPYRAHAVEQALQGGGAGPDDLGAAASHAAEGVTPLEDLHASAAYRTHLARVITRRALEGACAQATGAVA